MSDICIIKQKKDLICFTYKDNGIPYFAKVFYLQDNKKLQTEYIRELKINKYIDENLKDKTYHTSLLQIHENIIPFEFIIPFVSDKELKCNILIFEHAGYHPLRYYINRLSTSNFNHIIIQLKIACDMLQDIDVVHYDLYCESNIMLQKNNNKWNIKIIDYGLSYIDETEKSDYDYNIAIESISTYNKKYII
jgi:tRNA A-37 threonylcarbamoyl transferase component Bud32